MQTTPIRECLLTKIVATLFVVLIVVPCTPPFQSYDSGVPIGAPASHDLKASDKLASDLAAAVLARPPDFAPFAVAVLPVPPAPACEACGATATHAVLRL